MVTKPYLIEELEQTINSLPKIDDIFTKYTIWQLSPRNYNLLEKPLNEIIENLNKNIFSLKINIELKPHNFIPDNVIVCGEYKNNIFRVGKVLTLK